MVREEFSESLLQLGDVAWLDQEAGDTVVNDFRQMLGLVVLEAMASGTPVVCSRLGGLS
jgi:glycosyltransferase involved in cell wall biosynthesis